MIHNEKHKKSIISGIYTNYEDTDFMKEIISIATECLLENIKNRDFKINENK